jgi:hypothetical protein
MNRILHLTQSILFTINFWNLIVLFATNTESTVTTGLYLAYLLLITPFVTKIIIILTNQRLMTSYCNFDTEYKHRFQLVESINLSKKLLKLPIVDPKIRYFKKNEIVKLSLKMFRYRGKNPENMHDIGEILTEIASQKLTALVMLNIADFLLTNCGYISRAYIICNKVLNYSYLRFNERFTAMMIIHKIQSILHEHKSTNIDLIGFMDSMESHTKLGDYIEKQIIHRVSLYKLIDSDNPCLRTISELSRKIQEIQKKITNLWSNLTSKNLQDYPPLLKMYAYFKIFVELQHETGKTFIKKYNNTIIRRQILENGLEKTASIYSSKSAFLVIGAENTNLGKILSCTSNIYKIVGRPSRNLMGRNISEIMPSSIAAVHDNFLKTRLDNAEKLIEFTRFNSLALHEKGYIVPVALNVTVYPSLNEGFCFWGMIN